MREALASRAGNSPEPGRQKPARSGSGNQEAGVALLLSLGILSLLLILAMSFAYTARTNRASSQVNADLTRARLLCESGLERALAYLQTTYSGSGAVTAPATYYPATATSGFFFAGPTGSGTPEQKWDGRYYAVSQQSTPDSVLIESALAVNLGFDFTPKWQDQRTNPLHASQSWQPIKDDSGKLLGRIAFLIIDESGKLDPNEVVTFREPFPGMTPTTGYTSGPYSDVDGDGAYTNTLVAEGTEIRSGACPQEISLACLFGSPAGDDFRTKMPVRPNAALPTSPAVTLPTRWFSWFDMYEAGITGMTSTAARNGSNVLFPCSYDIEAWDDAGTDRHRFDLTTADWNNPATVTVASLQAAATEFWDASVSPATIRPSTGGIPWLDASLADSTGAASPALSNQVCANLIDYCDTNSTATNDVVLPSGTWPSRVQGSATYVGLEKVPYINEVSFVALRSATAGPPPQQHVGITVTVELANLYGAAQSGRVTVDVWYTGFPNNTNPTKVGWTYPTPPLVAGATNVTVNPYSYATVSFPLTDFYWNGAGTGAISFGVTAINVTLTDASGNLWDFAVIGASPSTYPLDGDTNTTCSATVEAIDPRCNTNQQTGARVDWVWNGFASLVGGTPNAVNLVTNATGHAPNGDAEAKADPVAAPGLSTAYIRNAPPKSLWELGAIHRGEPWCTLSLKAYNDGSQPKTYANGDARILDQVKLGPEATVRGRINANSPQSYVWNAVLYGIKVGDNSGGATDTTYGAPAPGTANIVIDDLATEITPLATAILAQNGATAGQPFSGRGGIAAVPALRNDSVIVRPADRQQEEIIGKIANLLTVRQNYFTVVVTGQAARDLDTVNAPGSVAWKDESSDKYLQVLAEQRIGAVVYRDAFRNTYRVERYEFLEE